MSRLIDKIKPEVLRALERHVKPQYGSSYRTIIAVLSRNDRYRQLSIEEVDQLILFLPQELHPNGRTDFYYGDYLLQKKYQV